MILKKLTLKNIRSYVSQEIVFPQGSTILAGDIGAGKTSVLLAIEFALFGLQPGQKGASLLRNGEKEGSVSLEFEIDGKNVLIERSLKRGKSISQEDAKIAIDGEEKEMSVTELKNLVLSLLSYPGEFAKKSNVLYRFTVYTPQEEMKQIILENSEGRLDTLRHVFGIDKYKRIKENVEIVRLKMREEIKTKQGMIFDLDEKKQKKIIKLGEIEKLKSSLLASEKEFSIATEKRKIAESSVNEIKEKTEEKKKIEHEIEKTRVLVSGKREMFSSLVKEQERDQKYIDELDKLSFNELELQNLENQVQSNKKNLDDLNKKYYEVSGQISPLTLSNLETDKLRMNLASLENCPTCLQEVNLTHKSSMLSKFDSQMTETKKKIIQLSEEKSSLLSQIDSIKNLITTEEKRISELKVIKMRLEALNEKKSRLGEIEKQKILLEKDFELLEKHIESLKSITFELSKYDLIFQTKEKELEIAKRQEKIAEISLSGIQKELELTQKQITELEKEIESKENTKKNLNYLMSLNDWLSTTFIEFVSVIEKNVMLKLRDEFSKLFNEWFNILVPEIFSVNLDDTFSPIIEQQDYELDYNFLSGGERTAIALAYRLALNQTINSLLSKIKTKDIVILDEPTDGFSEQQLDKMRDVLSQLKVKQLILVSHESKIEGFVENIIKFKKDQGITRVES